MIFFQKNPKKNGFLREGGGRGKGVLATVNEFVLQKVLI